MTIGRRIIHDNATLSAEYENLTRGDTVVGRLRLRPGEEHVLLDLIERGVNLIPSATSQLCSRSKVYQAKILRKYMVPGTRAVYDRHTVLSLVSEYGRMRTERVVCKLDRGNGGQGILLFPSVEDVYNSAVLGTLPYPFVIQPFVEASRDVRVVILGDLVDAYTRCNPSNFRHNLHCGGSSEPFALTAEQKDFCLEVMARAKFPYAHVDLLLAPDGSTWLSEINLRGGLRGATLSQQDYLKAVEKLHGEMLLTMDRMWKS